MTSAKLYARFEINCILAKSDGKKCFRIFNVEFKESLKLSSFIHNYNFYEIIP